MQQIAQALKRKQAQLAKLTKDIELLQQAEVTLREIAPLLAEAEEEDSSLLAEVEDEVATPAQHANSAVASAGNQADALQSYSTKPAALRWP